MAGRGESMASGNRIAAAEKRRQALELKKAGVSFEVIGERLGMSTSNAHKTVMTALDAIIRPAAEEVRQLEIERIDAMLLAIWPQIKAGHLGAIDRGIRLMERRARLLGLDAPKESNLNVTLDVQEAAKKIAADLNIPVDVVLAETYRMVEDGAA